MVSGALQAALIPVLAHLVLPDRATNHELRRVGGALVTWALLATGVFSVLGIVFAPGIVSGLVWIAGDDAARGAEVRELTVRLVRIVMPAAALLGVGTALQAMLHALGAVTAPALSTAVRNASIIVGMIVLADAIGVESMAWGTLAGSVAIILVQLVPLHRHRALPVPNLDLRHPAIRRMGVLYLPVCAGLLVSSAAVVVDRGLAWGAGEYAVGAIRYATTLVQLVLGLVAAAMSLASLPALSRHFSAGNAAGFNSTLSRVMGMVTVLILPATAGLAVLASPIAALLFGHGETGEAGTHAITIALLGYLPGTLAAAYDQILIFAFYARQNTLVPVLVGVVAVGVYFIVAFGLVDRYGMMGLVIANSAQFVVHALVMWWAIGRLGVNPFGAGFRHTLRGAAIGAAAMAVVVFLVASGFDAALTMGESVAGEVIQVVIPACVGALIYVAVLRMMRVTELTVIVDTVRGRFVRPTKRS